MSKKELQQRIRRSASLSHKQLEQSYMEYIKIIKDKRRVFQHMEDCKIGIKNPIYWLERLKHLAALCQYNQIARLMHKIKGNKHLRNHDEFYQLLDFQKKVINQLKRIYNSRHCGRRSAYQYKLFSMRMENQNPRKIGQIQIWVDDTAQKQFHLEDYAKVIEQKFPIEKQNAKTRYEEQTRHLSYSFLYEAEQNLEKKSNQLLKSFNSSNFSSLTSIENFSSKKSVNAMDNQNQVQQQNSNESNNYNKNKKFSTPERKSHSQYDQLKQLDSVQIIQKRNLWKKPASPKFNTPGNPVIQKSIFKSNAKLKQSSKECFQYFRGIKNNKQQYSFQKKQNIRQQQHFNSRYQMQTQSFHQGDALIQQNTTSFENQMKGQQYSFMLGAIINQCQQQMYQNKKISSQTSQIQINSNQQNQNISSVSISLARKQKRLSNPNKALMQISMHDEESQRKSSIANFEELLQNFTQDSGVSPYFRSVPTQRRGSMSQKANRKRRNNEMNDEEQDFNNINKETGFIYSFSRNTQTKSNRNRTQKG